MPPVPASAPLYPSYTYTYDCVYPLNVEPQSDNVTITTLPVDIASTTGVYTFTSTSSVYTAADVTAFLRNNPDYPQTREAGQELDAIISANGAPKNYRSLQLAWNQIRARISLAAEESVGRLRTAQQQGEVERYMRKASLEAYDPFDIERE